MIVKILNTYLSIIWRHNTTAKKKKTTCIIKVDKQVIAEANSYCHEKDKNKYTKNMGRKVALGKVLGNYNAVVAGEQLGLPMLNKAERSEIWQQYYLMRHNKW